jgi:hypothetical protein
MHHSPNLSPEHLISPSWVVFKRVPILCIGMALLVGLFSGGGGGGGGGSGTGNEKIDLILLVLLVGFGCLGLIVGPPLKGGMQLAFVRMLRGDSTVRFGDLFTVFADGQKFLNLVLANLILAGISLIGFCLCIVPGVIAVCGLFPTFMLIMEDDLDAVDAIKKAWDLTNGHKGEIFLYGVVVFFLNLAGLLACCVGLLVTVPVGELGWMKMYLELRGPEEVEDLATEEDVLYDADDLILENPLT